jgi:geranylgeranyl diphosphate synthase type I
LPVATGLACGGPVDALAPLAAAVVVMATALRILDDLADADDPDALDRAVGPGRAAHAAAALSAVAWQGMAALPAPPGQVSRLRAECLAAYLRVCWGQEQDMAGQAHTLDGYLRIVQAKTVAPYEFAALAGGLMATDDAERLARCQACGAHLGWLTQILDDIEALWFPDGPSDLELGRLTYPTLFGLAMEHPRRRSLRVLLAGPRYDVGKVRVLLDEMGVRRQLLGQALDHRDAALAALDAPLHPAGRAVLQPWLDWLFRDGARLMGSARP